MKKLADRVEKLENEHMVKQLKFTMFDAWCTDDEEEYEDLLVRGFLKHGLDVTPILVTGWSGHWEERPGGNVWIRPLRAETRYQKWGDKCHPADVVERALARVVLAKRCG